MTKKIEIPCAFDNCLRPVEIEVEVGQGSALICRYHFELAKQYKEQT